MESLQFSGLCSSFTIYTLNLWHQSKSRISHARLQSHQKITQTHTHPSECHLFNISLADGIINCKDINTLLDALSLHVTAARLECACGGIFDYDTHQKSGHQLIYRDCRSTWKWHPAVKSHEIAYFNVFIVDFIQRLEIWRMYQGCDIKWISIS